MSLESAGKMLVMCCYRCRRDAIRACLPKQPLLIYDAVIAGGGTKDIGDLALGLDLGANLVGSQLIRLARAGLVKARIDTRDCRFSYYRVVNFVQEDE